MLHSVLNFDASTEYTQREHRVKMATKAFEHHAYAVRAAKDGTLGYSDGKKYVPIYGRLQHVSDDATSVKVTSSQHIDTSIGISVGMEGPSMDLSGNRRRTREETFFMENALFKYERESGSEVTSRFS